MTEVKALTVIPVFQELDACAYLGLYSPIIGTDDGTRYNRRSDFDLFDDNGRKIDWDGFGIRESVSLYAASDGKIVKGIVHGNLEGTILMWKGETFYDSGYVFFTTQSRNFLYSSNSTEATYPRHVAMKVQKNYQFIKDIALFKPGCEVVYSPNPDGYRGYAIFSE